MAEGLITTHGKPVEKFNLMKPLLILIKMIGAIDCKGAIKNV